PLSPLTIPQTPARFLNVAPHGLCRTPQRCVSIIAFGTYGDVARCGWEDWNQEQWQRDISLCLNMITHPPTPSAREGGMNPAMTKMAESEVFQPHIQNPKIAAKLTKPKKHIKSQKIIIV
ncbi:MAG: hypothetical protein K2N54_07405, partial [Helicobacter sp.]|nr:hypothetical protein [Helicobacter sp.]